MSPKSKCLLVVGLAALLGGCADYMNHRDSITLGAGNAPEANIGIHTVDPFPPEAENTNIKVDGTKVNQAHQRYLVPCDPDVVRCTQSSGSSGTTEGADG